MTAERLPTEHVPLQALPPQHLHLDEALPVDDAAGAAGEVQQALPSRRAQQHMQPYLVQQHLTTHLVARTDGGSRQARPGLQRLPQPRKPGQGAQQRPTGGSSGFGSIFGAELDDHGAIREARPAPARQGGGGSRAAGAGASAGQRGAGGPHRQRRRRQGGGSSTAADRMYRGGLREDELPDGGQDLLGEAVWGWAWEGLAELAVCKVAAEHAMPPTLPSVLLLPHPRFPGRLQPG